MGRAFHRKQLSFERGSRARGSGIRYVEPRVPIVRELSPEELAQREAAKAAAEASSGIRKWNIYALTEFSGLSLDSWEDGILAEMKEERCLDSEQAIDRIMQMVRSVADKHCDSNGVEIDLLFQSLEHRRIKASGTSNRYFDTALNYLITRLSEMFDKVLQEQEITERTK
jgi:hypothetical protein